MCLTHMLTKSNHWHLLNYTMSWHKCKPLRIFYYTLIHPNEVVLGPVFIIKPYQTPLTSTTATYVIKQVSLHFFSTWKEKGNGCTRSRKGKKSYRSILNSSLNVVVEIIMRAPFVWSFTVLIVRQCGRGESGALSRTLCWIICSKGRFLPKLSSRKRIQLNTPDFKEELEEGTA